MKTKSETNQTEFKISRLNTFMSNHGFSLNQMASKIGLHPKDLEDLMKGMVPFQEHDPAWTLVDLYLNEMDGKVYPTRMLKMTHRMLSTLFDEAGIGVVTGNSGAGKTESCRQYCLKNPDAIYIRVNEVFTTKYMLAQMLTALGSSSSRMTKQQLFESICAILSTKKKLFIIDEAERLEVSQLEALRDVYDATNIGLCFVGLEKLRSLLKAGRSLKEDLVQLYSRVSYNEQVDILDPADVRMIVNDKLPGNTMSDDKAGKLSQMYKRKGGVRAMLKLCNLVEKLMEKNKDKFPVADDIIIGEAVNQLTL